MTPAFDTVAWFQIGTPDPAAAQRFYGELFGWTYRTDPGSGDGYQLISYPGATVPSGGIAEEQPGTGYAVFCVMVRDVAATCDRATELGGKVLAPPATTPDGLVSADLLDSDGNRFMVFTPAPR
ncbi:VOC family protein [Nocardia transvalensis]|uniref:VOC family protein n=1 Tax=Nocardia transvalensis TaxID=37333 RepID=UPI0018935320|nr:VOC family protein [Nocardia transvalensis]MBF6330354.1 VOC family protein [Nocardia transvalensis]